MVTSVDVTVLCSTYNSSKWIDGYLESINNQTLEEFSIIFVDAASTDDSLQTIKDFKFREGINVEVLECEDKVPIYEAWNLAIKLCETSYVVNVNTDDRLHPAALEAYLSYARTNPSVDVFYSAYTQVEDVDHKNVTGLFIPPNHDHRLLLNHCYCGPFPLLKKETIVEEGLFDPKYTISGDYEMWLRMSKNNRSFVRVLETVGTYYYNPEGMSTNRESKHWQEHVRQDTELRRLYA